jgi:hypothetical protein
VGTALTGEASPSWHFQTRGRSTPDRLHEF